ncbi:MAG: ComF family protein [Bacillota bacterium]
MADYNLWQELNNEIVDYQGDTGKIITTDQNYIHFQSFATDEQIKIEKYEPIEEFVQQEFNNFDLYVLNKLKSTPKVADKCQPDNNFRQDYDSVISYLWIYFPEKYEKKYVPSHRQKVKRKKILDFKIGFKNDVWTEKECVRNVISKLQNDFGLSLENKILVPIPASKKKKTEVRYKSICKKISQKTGIKNGFGVFTNKYDTAKAHNSKQEVNLKSTLHLNIEKIKGEHIILFDDIYTTGEHFRQAKAMLMEAGAKKVDGLFLGKTIWFEELFY